MLVHKGSQINNVQLITGLRIAEMSQLQNCSVMCTKNGSYCENETSSPKGNDRSPDNKQVFQNSSQVSKRFFSIGQGQLTLQSMV